jgi:predicted DNA-binding protein (MmcQ/YjbR family)
MMDAAEHQLQRVRGLLAELEDVLEKTAWGAPTFRTAGRMFASFAEDHHNDGRLALWLLCDMDHRDALLESMGPAAFVPPYVGKSGWIGILLPSVDDTELRELLCDAHTLCRERAGKRPRKPPSA